MYYDDDEAYTGPDLLLPRGYQTITKGLAKGLDIRTAAKVTEISHTKTSVSVTTSKGTFEGDRVIVTLPLGILKRDDVTFSPPLPEKKRTAIKRLGMGVLNKFYMKFPEVFWQDRPETAGYLGNPFPKSRLEIREYFTVDAMLKQPILLGFSAGSHARELEKVGQKALQEACMQTFRRAYGRKVPDPVAVLQTKWASDPYAYGSYSYIAVGARGEDYEVLGQPVGERLFFAGEATNRENPGTVHGAYSSGLKAAESIADL